MSTAEAVVLVAASLTAVGLAWAVVWTVRSLAQALAVLARALERAQGQVDEAARRMGKAADDDAQLTTCREQWLVNWIQTLLTDHRKVLWNKQVEGLEGRGRVVPPDGAKAPPRQAGQG